MSADVVGKLIELDQNVDLHVARLLILLGRFAGVEGQGLKGLTKLAKLDFLLRYPVLLERALIAKNASLRGLTLQPHERDSVESQMVRYRFGPWDHRYREILNIMIARGLLRSSTVANSVLLNLTPRGIQTRDALMQSENFRQYDARAEILQRHFDVGGTALMRFIYATFPEVLSLRKNAPITI